MLDLISEQVATHGPMDVEVRKYTKIHVPFLGCFTSQCHISGQNAGLEACAVRRKKSVTWGRADGKACYSTSAGAIFFPKLKTGP